MKRLFCFRNPSLPVLLFVAGLLGLVMSSDAQAQNKVGGHFGAVFPLVTHADGDTTDIGDNFTVGFPMGINVKREGSPWSFDLEFVPFIQDRPRNVSLLVHPGVLRDVSDRVTLGVRGAFEIDSSAWGFTPLVNVKLNSGDRYRWFTEFVVPVRFVKVVRPGDDNFTAVTFGVHFGVGF